MHRLSVTTIQVDLAMRAELNRRKTHPRETYNEVLRNLLEDLRELDAQTKREIRAARAEIRAGRLRTHDQVRERLSL
ncbi:MAG: hypothetical protein KGJ23_11975 [Euryarchaeota archaeon]|nr:hypothetical protein [Euryarchaeota archaeon]MDE1837314.1 hypothetical protein [Euryarchaeota archaeon]MDE1879814.1 hypothetical protein [Euryarchaeota archaeon]MDE2045255.1 hypothetical protein [Thermoplasmata archaeon]